MKKTRILICFMLSIFIGMMSVKADGCTGKNYQCIMCRYENNEWRLTYYVSADGTGGQVFVGSSPQIEEIKKHPTMSGMAPITRDNDIFSSYFYDNEQKKLVCPGVIYVSKSITSYTFQASKGDSVLQKKKTNDNGKPYKSSLVKDDVKTCSITSFDGKRNCSIKVSNSGVEVQECKPAANVTVDSSVTPSLFKNGCKASLRLECHMFDANCTLKYGEGYGSTEGKDTEKQSDYKDDIEKDTIKIGTLSCETISKLTDFSGKIYQWIIIFMVVGLVILTMFDYMKAVIASDDDKIKKANKHVVTRIIIVIIIFLLPTLINMVFNMLLPSITTCIDF